MQEVVGLPGEWCVERDDIALRQQFVKGHTAEGGFWTTVMGKHPTAEAPKPFDHFSSDTTCSDHTDRHVAELPTEHLVQSIVMRL